MKKRILMMVVLLLVVSASVALAMDNCPAWKEVPGSANGAYADYDITFPVWLAPGWEAVLKGNESPEKRWIYHKIVAVDPVKSTATARVYDWESGEDMELSTGKYDKGDLFPGVNLDEIVHWSDPTVCPELLYPKDALPEDRHYKMKLGEKFQPKTNNVQPVINYLLLLKKSESSPQPPLVIHQCAVLSVKRTATYGEYGEYGDYEIVLSLQKFHGAPPYALPYVDRQTAPDYVNIAWTGFGVVKRQDDTAVVEVKNWPITWSIRLSIKLMADGINYWQDMYEWLFMDCQNNYFSYGDNHFIIPLN